jgi:hypothetical protein
MIAYFQKNDSLLWNFFWDWLLTLKKIAYFAAVYSTEKRDDDSAEGHVEQVAVVVVAKVPRNSG